jgi:hypothetical protein
MQIILQDLMEYSSVMGAISPALRQQWEHELVRFAPAIIALGGGLIAAGLAAMAHWGVAAVLPAFLLGLIPFMYVQSRNDEPSRVKIKFMGLKASLQGNIALACLVGGILLLALLGAAGYLLKA